MGKTYDQEPFAAAHLIREIGRGAGGARSLSRADARLLYAAMLDAGVSDLELGAVLLAMRIKGESVAEIAGFLEAAEASLCRLDALPGEYAPVVIPSYNGARRMPNLTPLFALLLARAGVPVLVHGVLHDSGRVTTAEILELLGLPASDTNQALQTRFARRQPAFMAIDVLAPRMERLLSLRRILGVRNSTHTLVKLLQPFGVPALRLTSYTHPEYFRLLSSYFVTAAPVARGDVFLMRGTEGETVANAKRAQQIEWFHGGQCTVLVHKQAPVDAMPALPHASDASTTAVWIEQALAGRQPVPAPLAQQVEHCLLVSRQIAARSESDHVSERDISS